MLIDPAGRGQLGATEARLPHVARITSLEAALAAIEQIKEQGEGSTGSQSDSHFHRFNAIKEEWAELLAQDPGFEPAWPAAHDPVMRRPAEGLERVFVTAPEAAGCLDLGNACYGAMLGVLEQVFGAEDVALQARLMNAAVELMEASAACANTLARMPATEDSEVNAGLSFTVPRNLGYRPGFSTARLGERIDELRRRGLETLQGEAAEKVERRLASALAALKA